MTRRRPLAPPVHGCAHPVRTARQGRAGKCSVSSPERAISKSLAQDYDAFCGLSRRRHVPPNFAEARLPARSSRPPARLTRVGTSTTFAPRPYLRGPDASPPGGGGGGCRCGTS